MAYTYERDMFSFFHFSDVGMVAAFSLPSDFAPLDS